MTTANENAIRDELAARLHLLEPGLQHVKNNYHLVNEHGADGFVDILARDSTGAFVVIELKKASSTSRQALHEVSKYVDLLGRDKGLAPEQVRAAVVSTHWHELLVPFSYYAHQVDFSLQGFLLELNADGLTPEAAQLVAPLARSRARSLTPSQRRIDAADPVDLTTSWSAVKNRLADLEVEDFVALHLSAPDDARMVVLALGTITSEAPRDPMYAVLLAEGGFAEAELDDVPTEEVVLLGLEYEGLPMGVCYPEKVASLVSAHGWKVDEVERFGVFQDEDLFPEKDVKYACEGWTGGLSSQHFQGRARTTNPPQWAAFRGGIASVIADSPGWVEPARLWLDEVQDRGLQWDISANVYDIHDMLQMLLHGWRNPRWVELVPHLVATVEITDGGAFGLVGRLSWDGTPVNLVAGLRHAYSNMMEWGELRAVDGQAEANARLLEAWHLNYELTEKRASESTPDLLVVDGHRLQRKSPARSAFDDGMMASILLMDFIDAHEEQLDELVAYLRDHVIAIDAATATQMLAFDARVDSDWY